MWIFHNFPSVVHSCPYFLNFTDFLNIFPTCWLVTFPPKNTGWHCWLLCCRFVRTVEEGTVFFGWIPWETVVSTEFRWYIWLVVGNMTLFLIHYFPYIGDKYLKWLSHFSEKLNSPTSDYYVCILQFIQSHVCIYIYNRVICVFIYIYIHDRVLRTKWLMMVRYASETWVDIRVSYCWCGLSDPWDQHLCCFHHQSHLDTDASAVGLLSVSKPQTNITLKNILNDTV